VDAVPVAPSRRADRVLFGRDLMALASRKRPRRGCQRSGHPRRGRV